VILRTRVRANEDRTKHVLRLSKGWPALDKQALDTCLSRASVKGLKMRGKNVKLFFPEPLASRTDKTTWASYCKKPFGGPEQVLEYLGRYTHRVAISNYRIVNVENGEVTISYR